VCGDEIWRDVELRSCTHITHASATDLLVTIRPSSGHRAFPHVWFVAWFTAQWCFVPHLSDTIGNVPITDCHPVLVLGDFNTNTAGVILQRQWFILLEKKINNFEHLSFTRSLLQSGGLSQH
jgi:hypothetical protein